jgi:hypothetical protein
MVGIIGDRVWQLGERGEYWMWRKGTGVIWYSDLQGGSPHLCRLRPTSVEPWWTSIQTVLMYMGHMESPNWVASSVAESEAILPYLTGVHRDSAWATHGVSAEAYTWKMCTRMRWAPIVSLTSSWIVATRGALLACMCQVVRFVPLQGWVLIRISVTPSNMGDGSFAVFKHRIINS